MDTTTKKYAVVIPLLVLTSMIAVLTQYPQNRAECADSASVIADNRTYAVTIRRVVDGDTVDITVRVWRNISVDEHLRLSDIDTWEVRGEHKTKGLAAREFLIGVLEANAPVYIKTEGETGSFGRLLGTLHVTNKHNQLVNVSELLRASGHSTN